MTDAFIPESTNENPIKTEARKEYEKCKFYYRFLFPSKFTGLVVGKGGSRVKELREAHNIDIFIKETKGPERLIRFKSDSAEVIGDCMKDISTAWLEKMRSDFVPKLKEEQTEVRLICHKTQAGCIIGKGGEGIKALRAKHNCMILLNGECMPRSSERCCQIAGTPDEVRSCLVEILYAINEKEVEFDSKEWYNPDNWDDYKEYGGFTDKRGRRRERSRSPSGRNRSRSPRGRHSSRSPPRNRHRSPPRHFTPVSVPGWVQPAGQPILYSQPYYIGSAPMAPQPVYAQSQQQQQQSMMQQPLYMDQFGRPMQLQPVQPMMQQYNDGMGGHHQGRKDNQYDSNQNQGYFR